ncbi:hypothetical protein ORI20_13775 [Mycobacterium sp. CVI_P3]|uniref:HNH endonuclease n=1 Tax=Mycobacterium pinniadriaticum TaxID=2994102 RepID=A0ABT3SE36_9MYCO|nr:hypothetical protein [Mycobacterium pinniadriaticum]MCX2931348.1 hypothetical protein [Mycobacterium pinniadriaticum]MCX2937772.1 hypothetical protein [Mycobacterium pinniadriaticum]
MSHRPKHRRQAWQRRVDRVLNHQPADPSNRTRRGKRARYCLNCHTVFKTAPAGRIHVFLRSCFKAAA